MTAQLIRFPGGRYAETPTRAFPRKTPEPLRALPGVSCRERDSDRDTPLIAVAVIGAVFFAYFFLAFFHVLPWWH